MYKKGEPEREFDENKLREVILDGLSYVYGMKYPTNDIVTPLTDYFRKRYNVTGWAAEKLAIYLSWSAVYREPRLVSNDSGLLHGRKVELNLVDLNGQLDGKVETIFRDLKRVAKGGLDKFCSSFLFQVLIDFQILNKARVREKE